MGNWDHVFKFFDEDNSGNLSFAEIKTKTSAMGATAEKLAALEKIFNDADKDKSGELDVNEFDQMMNNRVKAAFEKIDADKSGNISPAELKQHTDKDISGFLAVADKDGDGEISLSEFTAALASKPKEFLPILFGI